MLLPSSEADKFKLSKVLDLTISVYEVVKLNV